MEAMGRVSKLSLTVVSFRSLNGSYSFCHLVKINSARPWETFLRQGDVETIKVFLTGYVRNAVQLRFVLDARERAKVRMVRHASTVVLVWRALISAADFHIMEPKRQAQPKKARFWRLQWLHHVEGRLTGPGFKVVLVSDTFLSQRTRDC
jgi:hypothetical protein